MDNFDDDLIKEIKEEMCENLSRLVDLVSSSQFEFSNEGEFKDLLRHLHSAKGNANAIGFNSLSSLLHELEDKLLSENFVETRDLKEDLETFFVNLLTIFEKLQNEDEFIAKKNDFYSLMNSAFSPNSKLSVEKKGLNVLIVDDNEQFLEMFYETLSMNFEDWNIDKAYDGDEGLNLTQETSYDLILTDYFMPKMNGDEFIKNVRMNSLNQKVSIILVTAFKPDFDTTSNFWENVFFIEKPLNWKRLKFMINCSFREKKAS